MSIINSFGIFRFFPHNLRTNIKRFYVSQENYFNEECSYFAYCVTNDDCVYGLGETLKICGYDFNSKDQYLLINELSHKNIVEFFEGVLTMFALNGCGSVYYWSRLDIKVLGKQSPVVIDEYYSVPKRIPYFDDKNIVQISCNERRCLALSSDAIVYSYVSDPNSIDLKFEQMVQFVETINSTNDLIMHVHCGELGWDTQHFIVTKNGYLYQLSDQKEWIKIFDFNSIVVSEDTISCSQMAIRQQHFSILIDEEENINRMFTNRFIFSIGDKVYNISLKKFDNSVIDFEITKYKDIFEYVLANYHSTFKTVQIIDNIVYIYDNILNGNILTKQLKRVESDFTSLDRFQFTNDLSKILKTDVKCYIQSRHRFAQNYFTLFVGTDDKVYVFGGCNENIEKGKDFKVIDELTGANVEEFFVGTGFIFARNIHNDIFSWAEGYLYYQSLLMSEDVIKPNKMTFFDNKNIIEISCGLGHCLALSIDGIVYGWGKNGNGQLGNQITDTEILSPIKMNDIYCDGAKIKYIYCKCENSFMITTDGIAYAFEAELSISPIMIDITGVKKICNYLLRSQIIIILTETEDIYFNNLESNTSYLIELDSHVLDIHDVRQDNTVIVECDDYVYDLKDLEIKKTDYINYFDYMFNKFNCTEKTIHIANDGYLYTKSYKFNEKFNENSDQSLFVCKSIDLFERKFDNLFEELDKIGQGSYGSVVKVKNWETGQIFAVKCVEIKNEFSLNEIRIMSKVKSDFVIQCYDSWIEGKAKFGKKIAKYLFIQMEMCSQNLRQFLGDSKKMIMDKFTIFNYYISCKIFEELKECVKYLHELNPPIIHRDLKPENALISDGSCGRLLKLCDFGLAKVHQNSIHSQRVGTDAYMAPEVKNNNQYNNKSDVYSLALIGTEIYHFRDQVKEIRLKENLNQYFNQFCDHISDEKIDSLKDLLNKCLFTEDYHLRPSCQQIINQIQKINVNENDLQINERYFQFTNEIRRLDDCPFKAFCNRILKIY